MRFLPIFCLFSILFAAKTSAQDFARLPVDVLDKSGNLLPLGFTGGWNSPQFSEADIDQDGQKELVVFERVGDRFTVFKRDAAAPAATFGWKFWPEGTNSFPDSLRHWVLLRDLDGDGATDLFCSSNSSNSSVDGYSGFFENGRLAFRKMVLGNGAGGSPFHFLFYEKETTTDLLNNVVSIEDYPAIEDINGDGDLDFITFNPGGGYVEYFENMGIERGFGKDTFLLKLRDKCFGKFYENGLAKTLSLSATPFDCSPPFAGGPLPVHPGSTQVMLDFDGDGDKEIILGDISFPNFVMPKNCGSTTNYWACEQDTLFPKSSVGTHLPNFPCPFYFDLDGDGKRDFVGAPNGGGVGSLDQSVWFYKNQAASGTAIDLAFQTKSAMVDQMFDLGTGAHPVIIDVDADGLFDLIVGNYGFSFGAGNYASRLVFLKNVGTATTPKFRIENDNWLDFAQFQNQTVKNLAPAFGDLDLDGDLDLLVGEEEGQFFFCENKAEFGEPLDFGPPQIAWLNMDVGRAATPFIIDLDGDGKNDIVAGERNGNLNFFKNKTPNQGAAVNFSAVPENGFLGSVNVSTAPGSEAYCAPTFFNLASGELKMLLGSNDPGRVLLFNFVAQTAVGTAFELENKDFGRLREGFRVHPAIGDLNKDGIFDLVVGNAAGGLSIFQTTLKTDGSMVSANEPTTDFDFLEAEIFPNPTAEKATIRTNFESGDWQLFDLFGRKILNGKIRDGKAEIDLTRSLSGIYVVEIFSNGKKIVKKVVKK